MFKSCSKIPLLAFRYRECLPKLFFQSAGVKAEYASALLCGSLRLDKKYQTVSDLFPQQQSLSTAIYE